MEEIVLILFFLALVLVFLAGFFFYLRSVRAEAKRGEGARLEALSELREQIRRLEHSLGELQDRLSAGVPARPAAAALPDLSQRIERELTQLGFSQIRLLSEPSPSEGDLSEVQISARKEHVGYKGRALLRGGAVVECRMQPSYEVFP